MRFNPEEWKKKAEKDFEAAWKSGKEVVEEVSLNEAYPRNVISIGKPHPVYEVIEKLRRAYLSLGFTEVINPLIVEDVHVKKQFGKEALAVLDRCFYLATLPRPNVGISEKQVERIREIIGDFDAEGLRKVFHLYKKGVFGGDELAYRISQVLNIDDSTALKILDEVFPEFKELKPVANNLTLRSHMTTGWFITLKQLIEKYPLPIKLFSIDRCFRREQGEDASRLYTYFSASCVYADEDVSVEDGKAIAQALLSSFGFERVKFKEDEKKSKYYIPGTQTEVYVYHPSRKEWIEVATFGIYSPVALANYEIDVPVLNLGMGVERLAMVIYGVEDVRKLVYPQIHDNLTLSDVEIASRIKLREVPKSKEGVKIAKAVIGAFEKHRDEMGPCEFLAYEGEFFGVHLKVYVLERENVKLCGPAAFNELVVYNGNIYGIPRTDKWSEYFENGVETGIRYVDAFSYLAAAKIEESLIRREDGEVRVRVVESPRDINVEIDEKLRNYVISRGGKIDVRGPAFLSARWEFG